MILLDTNILLRYAKSTDPAYPTVDAAIDMLHSNGENLAIVPQNLFEFWAVATRPIAANGLGLRAGEAQTQLHRLRLLFQFLPDQPALYYEWESLVLKHACLGRVSFDARLVAAMKTHGIERLLTFDGSDFSRFPGITLLDPHTLIANA